MFLCRRTISELTSGSKQAVVGAVHWIPMHHCFLLVAVLLIVAGCRRDNGLPLATVNGTVAFRGKLLERGEIVFTPHDGTPGPPAVGKIQSDGSFVMQTTDRDGAAIGLHKVTVHYRRKLTPEEIRTRALVVPESLIPEMYVKQDESPLTFQVEGGKTNVYDVVLD